MYRVVTYHLESGLITREHRKAIKDARNSALGPRKLRTPTKPVEQNGAYGEGLPWEADHRAVHVGTSERCYSLVHSYQSQRNLVGPSLGAKIAMDEPPSPHLLMREKIIKARMFQRVPPSNSEQALRLVL